MTELDTARIGGMADPRVQVRSLTACRLQRDPRHSGARSMGKSAI